MALRHLENVMIKDKSRVIAEPNAALFTLRMKADFSNLSQRGPKYH